MSWSEYVRHVAGLSAPQTEIASAAKVTPPTVSRWASGKQGVDPTAAANFARHYGRPVLEAFVAAGFLTLEEAKARPTRQPDLTQLSNKQLLDLIRSRMREDGEDHVSATTKKADDASAKPQQDDYGLASRRGRRQRTDEPGDGA